jgi:hypothetical protein
LLFEVTAWYRAARTRLRYGILKPAASVYVTSFGEWLEITPEGFFDASPNGATLLSIVRGLDVYSIDQFYDTLHRPDLVREKLAGDPQGKVREAAAKVDLTKAVASGNAPKVTIQPPASTTVTTAEGDSGGQCCGSRWRNWQGRVVP